MAGCVRRERQFVSSAQVDPGLALVGGSPFIGDLSATGILVPQAPTVSQLTRYLFRCCGAGLGPNQTVYVRSMRWYLWIGVDLTQNDGVVHFEQIVKTPGWRFPDSSYSFHLRRLGAGQHVATYYAGGGPPGIAGTSNGLTPALLGTSNLGVYTPFNAGLPYGDEVAGLGTVRDIRFPPDAVPNQDLDLKVVGPGAVVIYASIHQTDPATRINWAGPKHIRESLCPEDSFWVMHDQARFVRVGAEMVLDFCTWDPEGWCPDPHCRGYFNPDVACEHRPAGLVEVKR